MPKKAYNFSLANRVVLGFKRYTTDLEIADGITRTMSAMVEEAIEDYMERGHGSETPDRLPGAEPGPAKKPYCFTLDSRIVSRFKRHITDLEIADGRSRPLSSMVEAALYQYPKDHPLAAIEDTEGRE